MAPDGHVVWGYACFFRATMLFVVAFSKMFWDMQAEERHFELVWYSDRPVLWTFCCYFPSSHVASLVAFPRSLLIIHAFPASVFEEEIFRMSVPCQHSNQSMSSRKPHRKESKHGLSIDMVIVRLKNSSFRSRELLRTATLHFFHGSSWFLVSI